MKSLTQYTKYKQNSLRIISLTFLFIVSLNFSLQSPVQSTEEIKIPWDIKMGKDLDTFKKLYKEWAEADNFFNKTSDNPSTQIEHALYPIDKRTEFLDKVIQNHKELKLDLHHFINDEYIQEIPLLVTERYTFPTKDELIFEHNNKLPQHKVTSRNYVANLPLTILNSTISLLLNESLNHAYAKLCFDLGRINGPTQPLLSLNPQAPRRDLFLGSFKICLYYFALKVNFKFKAQLVLDQFGYTQFVGKSVGDFKKIKLNKSIQEPYNDFYPFKKTIRSISNQFLNEHLWTKSPQIKTISSENGSIKIIYNEDESKCRQKSNETILEEKILGIVGKMIMPQAEDLTEEDVCTFYRILALKSAKLYSLIQVIYSSNPTLRIFGPTIEEPKEPEKIINEPKTIKATPLFRGFLSEPQPLSSLDLNNAFKPIPNLDSQVKNSINSMINDCHSTLKEPNIKDKTSTGRPAKQQTIFISLPNAQRLQKQSQLQRKLLLNELKELPYTCFADLDKLGRETIEKIKDLNHHWMSLHQTVQAPSQAEKLQVLYRSLNARKLIEDVINHVIYFNSKYFPKKYIYPNWQEASGKTPQGFIFDKVRIAFDYEDNKTLSKYILLTKLTDLQIEAAISLVMKKLNKRCVQASTWLDLANKNIDRYLNVPDPLFRLDDLNNEKRDPDFSDIKMKCSSYDMESAIRVLFVDTDNLFKAKRSLSKLDNYGNSYYGIMALELGLLSYPLPKNASEINIKFERTYHPKSFTIMEKIHSTVSKLMKKYVIDYGNMSFPQDKVVQGSLFFMGREIIKNIKEEFLINKFLPALKKFSVNDIIEYYGLIQFEALCLVELQHTIIQKVSKSVYSNHANQTQNTTPEDQVPSNEIESNNDVGKFIKDVHDAGYFIKPLDMSPEGPSLGAQLNMQDEQNHNDSLQNKGKTKKNKNKNRNNNNNNNNNNKNKALHKPSSSEHKISSDKLASPTETVKTPDTPVASSVGGSLEQNKTNKKHQKHKEKKATLTDENQEETERLQAAKEKASQLEAEYEATAQLKAQQEAQKKEEARIKAEKGAKQKEEARIKAEKGAKQKEEARIKAEREAKQKEEARIKAEREAKQKEEARLKAEREAKQKGAARIKAEQEAKQKEEEARIKAQLEAKQKEEARINAQLEAKQKEEARIKAEQEAKQKEEEARIKAEREATQLKQKEEAKLKAERKEAASLKPAAREFKPSRTGAIDKVLNTITEIVMPKKQLYNNLNKTSKKAVKWVEKTQTYHLNSYGPRSRLTYEQPVTRVSSEIFLATVLSNRSILIIDGPQGSYFFSQGSTDSSSAYPIVRAEQNCNPVTSLVKADLTMLINSFPFQVYPFHFNTRAYLNDILKAELIIVANNMFGCITHISQICDVKSYYNLTDFICPQDKVLPIQVLEPKATYQFCLPPTFKEVIPVYPRLVPKPTFPKMVRPLSIWTFIPKSYNSSVNSLEIQSLLGQRMITTWYNNGERHNLPIFEPRKALKIQKKAPFPELYHFDLDKNWPQDSFIKIPIKFTTDKPDDLDSINIYIMNNKTIAHVAYVGVPYIIEHSLDLK